MDQIDIKERRTEERHPVKDNSAVMLIPENIISYTLLDISESGVAFAYNGPGVEISLKAGGTIELFGEEVGLSDIKVKIISDSQLDKNDAVFDNQEQGAEIPYLRRCGLQFVNLNDNQKNVIKSYIKHSQE